MAVIRFALVTAQPLFDVSVDFQSQTRREWRAVLAVVLMLILVVRVLAKLARWVRWAKLAGEKEVQNIPSLDLGHDHRASKSVSLYGGPYRCYVSEDDRK